MHVWTIKYELCDFGDSAQELNALNFALKWILYKVKMNNKIHTDDFYFHFIQNNIKANKHHDKYRETTEEKEKLFLLVPFTALFPAFWTRGSHIFIIHWAPQSM